MVWNTIFFGIRTMRTHKFRGGYENIWKYGQEFWRRWLGLGGLTAATGLSLAARVMMPPSFQQDATKLQLGAVQPPSHEQLIRQASTMTVDAATQLLSQTVLAYIEMSRQYRESLEDLMDLLSEDYSMMVVETSNEGENSARADYSQELWEREVDTRAKVSQLHNTLLELASYMEYVTKVATASAEASFLAGSEFASTNMCERLNSAHRTFEEEKSKNKDADRELLKVQENQASLAQVEGLSSPSLSHRVKRKLRPVSLIDSMPQETEVAAKNKAEN